MLKKLTVNTKTYISRTMSTMTPETLLNSRYSHVIIADIAGISYFVYKLVLYFMYTETIHIGTYTVRGIHHDFYLANIQ